MAWCTISVGLSECWLSFSSLWMLSLIALFISSLACVGVCLLGVFVVS